MTRTIRHAAIHIALIAIMLRALLPAGWMPNLGQPGSALIICAMDGAPDISPDHGGLPLKHQNDGRGDHDGCPFAAAPHLATARILPTIHQPQLAQNLLPGFGQYHAALALSGYAPQSPRAPPIFI